MAELGSVGSTLVPSLPNRAGTSTQMSAGEKTGMLSGTRGGPVESKKGRYNQNRNKRQNKRESSSDEIQYDANISELSTSRAGDATYVTRPKLTRLKEIARGGLTALTKLNKYGPFKRTLNESS